MNENFQKQIKKDIDFNELQLSLNCNPVGICQAIVHGFNGVFAHLQILSHIECCNSVFIGFQFICFAFEFDFDSLFGKCLAFGIEDLDLEFG